MKVIDSRSLKKEKKIKQEKNKYFEFYDDVKHYSKGVKEDW